MSADLEDEYTGPTDNGRLRPCAVVRCTEPGTHWRRDERRAVAQSVLVCIDHQSSGELPPIPPPVLDEVGDRLEALVRDAGEAVLPLDAARRLGIPLTEVYRIARARGLPLVSGRLRPPPPKATGPVALPKPKHVPEAPAKAREARPRPKKAGGSPGPASRFAPPPHKREPVQREEGAPTKPAPPVGSSPTKHAPAAERRGTLAPGNPPGPVSVASGPVEPAPGVTQGGRLKGRALRSEAASYRERLLACFPDHEWRPPREAIGALRAPGQTRNAAQTQFRVHAALLAAEGVLEAKGKAQSRRYRRKLSIAEAAGLVRDLVPRHPPSAPAPAHTPAPSASGEAAEGPGALGDRLGRALAAAARAFLAEWGGA